MLCGRHRIVPCTPHNIYCIILLTKWYIASDLCGLFFTSFVSYVTLLQLVLLLSLFWHTNYLAEMELPMSMLTRHEEKVYRLLILEWSTISKWCPITACSQLVIISITLVYMHICVWPEIACAAGKNTHKRTSIIFLYSSSVILVPRTNVVCIAFFICHCFIYLPIQL